MPESRKESTLAVAVMSGPASPDLPHRYGCSCGAVWNSSAPLSGDERLCGPYCEPKLFALEVTDEQ